MKPNAIVYTSNTGYTAEYAYLLGGKTGLPVYALAEAAGQLSEGSSVLYLGWLMAGPKSRICALPTDVPTACLS